jgi:hypothetical protein
MFKTIKINGRSVCYHNETTFIVQVGKGKSAYKNKYLFKGDIRKAAFYYESINIGNGYKKRLLMSGANKPVLARCFS